ncbi:MAG: hypothetical protein ACOC1U_01055 [Spirochaetota bacterium]
MTISAQQVKALREETGAAMMECKRALEAASGDHAAAALANEIAEIVLPLGGGYRGGPDLPARWETPVSTRLQAAVARIREKIVLASVVTLEARDDELIECYEHADGSLAAFVRLRVGSPAAGGAADVVSPAIADLGHELALHVAACAPRYVAAADIPASDLDALRAEYAEEARSAGKPADIVAKIVEGRIAKMTRTSCLLEQPYVKAEKRSVSELIASAARASGAPVVTGFAYDSVRDLTEEPGVAVG